MKHKSAQIFVVISALLIFSHSPSCIAWWEVGHMLTATVAQQELLRINPKIYEQAEQIVLALNDLSNDKSHTFIESAVWPDDIKSTGTNFWDNWHFYDRPVNPQGMYIIMNELQSKQNSIQSLDQARAVLQDDLGTITLPKAIMIRYVLHVVGDMHQPLHNSNMYNGSYKTGDLGGNLEKVIDLNNYTLPLHSYWDSGAEQFENPSTNWSPFVRPLNASAVIKINEMAKQITEEFPRSTLAERIKKYNTPDDWTQEGWRLSQDAVYPPFYTTNRISPQYQQSSRTLIREQIALGGYRLADYLISLLSGKKIPLPQKIYDGESVEQHSDITESIEYNPKYLNSFLKSKMLGHKKYIKRTEI